MFLKEMVHIVGQAKPLTLNNKKVENLRGSPIWSFLEGNERDLEIRVVKLEGKTSFLFLAMEIYVS